MNICTINREYYNEEIESDGWTIKLDGEYTMEDIEKILFSWKMKLWGNK